MLTAAQLRAARGLLDWTRADLAKHAHISAETIKNIEHGVFKPQETTNSAIMKAFAAHDVEFLDDQGVRLRRDTVTKYEGLEGFKKFMDDVYTAAADPSATEGGDKPICVSNVDDRLFIKYLGDYAEFHGRRMRELKNVKVRVLIREQDKYIPPEADHLEYRWNPNQNVSTVPFYVYGDKFAIIIFEENPSPQVIVISSALASKAYREQFETLWMSSKPQTKKRVD